MSARALFSRFLSSDPERLHVAAHSHHPWPDVTFEAQQAAWLDAAAHHDDKWGHVFSSVVPEFRRNVARRLALADPASVVPARNTHELVNRILSCLPQPTRILCTDAEFHSFTRQVTRLAEDGLAEVQRVPAEPFDSLAERFAEAAAAGGHHLVFVSQVLFDSGFALGPAELGQIVAAVPDPGTFVVVDGYHGFMAVPTDLSAIAARAFYLAGGYKYAMAGEGAAFAHCPPGYGPRPRDTGWYAGFSALAEGTGEVAYPADARRFLGATFDPTPLYRFNAVQRLLDAEGIDVADIHTHVAGLQAHLLDLLGHDHGLGELLPPRGAPRGHFLTFRSGSAGRIRDRLAAAKVVVDHRGDRLRLGFGLYHEARDVEALHRQLLAAVR